MINFKCYSLLFVIMSKYLFKKIRKLFSKMTTIYTSFFSLKQNLTKSPYTSQFLQNLPSTLFYSNHNQLIIFKQANYSKWVFKVEFSNSNNKWLKKLWISTTSKMGFADTKLSILLRKYQDWWTEVDFSRKRQNYNSNHWHWAMSIRVLWDYSITKKKKKHLKHSFPPL